MNAWVIGTNFDKVRAIIVLVFGYPERLNMFLVKNQECLDKFIGNKIPLLQFKILRHRLQFRKQIINEKNVKAKIRTLITPTKNSNSGSMWTDTCQGKNVLTYVQKSEAPSQSFQNIRN